MQHSTVVKKCMLMVSTAVSPFFIICIKLFSAYMMSLKHFLDPARGLTAFSGVQVVSFLFQTARFFLRASAEWLEIEIKALKSMVNWPFVPGAVI
jgi:hypothetical protein